MRPSDPEKAAFIRGKIVIVCEAVLREEIGIISGSRILNHLGFTLYDGFDSQKDEEFLTFVVIDSETDHLPVDRERANWSSEALERKDKEIAKSEAFYREIAFDACKTLIERYDMRDD